MIQTKSKESQDGNVREAIGQKERIRNERACANISNEGMKTDDSCEIQRKLFKYLTKTCRSIWTK